MTIYKIEFKFTSIDNRNDALEQIQNALERDNIEFFAFKITRQNRKKGHTLVIKNRCM